MLDVVLSLVPVFSLIALGAVLRRFSVLSVEGWAALERLTYFVLFPPLMFMSIVKGSFAGEEALWLGVALAATVLTMAALMIVVKPVLPGTGAQFSSVFQAGIRWNSYVALGVIAGMHGEGGVALSAVGFAVMIPINNVLSVLVLSRYASSKPASFLRVVQSVAANPLIISTVLAIVLVSLGVKVSKPVGDTLDLLGQATVSLGLICVGAALDFGSMKSAHLQLAIGTAFRLAVMPALAAGLMYAIGLDSRSFSIGMICVAAPVATSSYILARQLGGDATLMANIVTLTTLLSLITIPVTLLLTQMLVGASG